MAHIRDSFPIVSKKRKGTDGRKEERKGKEERDGRRKGRTEEKRRTLAKSGARLTFL